MQSSTTLPSWSYPLILGLVGIVLFIGGFSAALNAGIGVESVLFLGYVILRARRPAPTSQAPAKLLPLFPGHLLLLFAIAVLPAPQTVLAAAWMVVPAATVFYDITGRWTTRRERLKVSILVGLYCIIWADLFFVLERVIALARNVSGNTEIIVAAVFGVVGTVFICIGTYRHLRVVNIKE